MYLYVNSRRILIKKKSNTKEVNNKTYENRNFCRKIESTEILKV